MKKVILLLLTLLICVNVAIVNISDDYATVLTVEHTYDGTIERAGRVIKFQYIGAKMYVEFYDDMADGIFRNGFETVQEK